MRFKHDPRSRQAVRSKWFLLAKAGFNDFFQPITKRRSSSIVLFFMFSSFLIEVDFVILLLEILSVYAYNYQFLGHNSFLWSYF